MTFDQIIGQAATKQHLLDELRRFWLKSMLEILDHLLDI